MRKGRQPQSLVIVLSFLLAFILTILPWPVWLVWYQPNWVLLVLIFWLINAPYRVGIVVSWCVGLSFDLLSGTPLGVYAMIFTLLGYFMLRLNTMIRGYSEGRKIFLVFVVQTLALSIQYLISAHYHVESQTWRYWLPMVLTPLFWVLVVRLLQNKKDQLRVM